jgi:hypothetical protein
LDIFHSEEHLKNRFPLLKSKIRRLPPVHQATLKAVLEHLARVASHSATNKMDVRNLAIVFGTVIFGEDELPKNNDVLSMAAWKVRPHHVPLMFAKSIHLCPGYCYGGSHLECNNNLRGPSKQATTTDIA